MIEQNIKDIIQRQDPRVGMDQLFFTDKAVFDLSYDAIFKKQWVFLTHMSYFNDTATTEIYTSLFVGSVRCV